MQHDDEYVPLSFKQIDRRLNTLFDGVLVNMVEDFDLVPPVGTNNEKIDRWFTREEALIHFYVAQKGKEYWKKLSTDTKALLLEQQYITDDLEPGETDIVAEGYNFDIECRVNTPITKVDNTKLLVELRKLGVTLKVIKTAMDNAVKEQAPAKYYTFMEKV